MNLWPELAVIGLLYLIPAIVLFTFARMNE